MAASEHDFPARMRDIPERNEGLLVVYRIFETLRLLNFFLEMIDSNSTFLTIGTKLIKISHMRAEYCRVGSAVLSRFRLVAKRWSLLNTEVQA